MITRTVVKKSSYQDSVALLALARQLRSAAGVKEAAALMATPANKELLAQSGLLTVEAEAAGPNDLVIVVQADAASAEAACFLADGVLTAKQQRLDGAGRIVPRTLERARRHLPGANLVLISVPGAFAAAEARTALRQGLHVMLFSDNVPLDEEIALKQLAARKGLLLMGPDCGTAYLNGVPLGFANVVARGRVGLVAASGTGLQQVATLLAARGEGVSQAIGVGGRDMSEAVGGLMTLQALEALGADPATEIVVVIGKPPAKAVRRQVEARLRAMAKPSVVALLGHDVAPGQDGTLTTVATLEDAGEATLAALSGRPWARRRWRAAEIRDRLQAARRGLVAGQHSIRGLYCGGTLAHEAVLILEPLLGSVVSNLTAGSGGIHHSPGSEGIHQILDLGADELTIGRAHPMLDPTARAEEIRRSAKEPRVAVLLLDVG